ERHGLLHGDATVVSRADGQNADLLARGRLRANGDDAAALVDAGRRVHADAGLHTDDAVVDGLATGVDADARAHLDVGAGGVAAKRPGIDANALAHGDLVGVVVDPALHADAVGHGDRTVVHVISVREVVQV